MSDSVFDQNNVVDENYMIDQDKLPDGQPGQQSTSSQAVDEAKSVAADAASSGKAVAGAAKEEVAQVAGEAKNHAQDLYHQARSEVSSQAATQRDRVAGLLRLLTSELQEMGRSSQSGIANGLVGQAADQTERVAGWLESRDPSDLLEDIRRYARRKPGNFLAGAALAGFLGGRITRSLASQDDDADQQYVQQQRPVTTGPAGAVTTQHIPSAVPAYGGSPTPATAPNPASVRTGTTREAGGELPR